VQIDIATLFPLLCRDVLRTSMLALAQERGAVDVGLYDIRDFTDDRHRKVDDRPYGGGPGMLLQPGPVVRCVERILSDRGAGHVVLLTPGGRRFDQAVAREFAGLGHLVLICGHYEGFDERIVDLLRPDQVSLGDFVLTGGELAALTITDAVVRLLPGALGAAESARSDSFGEDDLLEAPQYTRPPSFRGLDVPEILLSGDHARVAEWRRQESLKRTRTRMRRADPARGDDPADETHHDGGTR
jgi:tRNA (guanine37-N1)-methyltransferase